MCRVFVEPEDSREDNPVDDIKALGNADFLECW